MDKPWLQGQTISLTLSNFHFFFFWASNFFQLYWNTIDMMLCKFKVYKVLTWHTYTLQYDYHGGISQHITQLPFLFCCENI